MLGGVSNVGLMCGAILSLTMNAAASDHGLAVIDDLSQVSKDHVIDIRSMSSCTEGSLPHARCLPMDYFVDPAGKVIGFHALRWLLGTVGLNGDEEVLVIGERAADTQKIGKLLHQAGQRWVWILGTPFVVQANAPSGTSRSFSRETVYTAAMRAY